MKLFFFATFALALTTTDSFAQRRDGGRRDGGRVRGDIRIGDIRIGIGRGGVRVGTNNRGRVSNRSNRGNRYGNGYARNVFSCDFDTLYYNSQFIHTFNYSYCTNAMNDVVNYGYFCDGTDMYTANGNFDSSYNSSNACRTALRY